MRERKIGFSYGYSFARRIRQILPGLLMFVSIIAIAQPANDPCNMPDALPVDGCVVGDLFGATFDLLNLGCVPPGSANVWYSFTAQGADYTIDVTGLGGQGQISLMQFTMGPCMFAGATQIECGGESITATNTLTPGSIYYVLITTQDGSEGAFNLCLNNPIDPPAPPNDDPCNPIAIAPGGCAGGTTADASSDWFADCAGNAENSVWYSVTLGPTANSLEVNLMNAGILGDVNVIIGSFPSGCSNNLVGEATYCGPATTTLTATNLTAGGTYYVMVATADIDAGGFSLCVTEMGPPPACLAIANCNTAFPINSGVPIPSNQMDICASGCNDFVPNGGCAGQGPTVYMSFSTDANADFVNLNLNSPGMLQPSIGLYDGCGGTLLACNTGSSNSVALTTVQVLPGMTYIISITDPLTTGSSFDLCVNILPTGLSNCADNSVVMTPTVSAPGAPFQPGETVQVCLNSTWVADGIGSGGNDCQWLHGITPEFGDCWDESSFAPGTQQPINGVTTNIGPVFSWYDSGVTYNNIPGGYLPFGAEVPPGWFTTTTPGNDPGCTDFTDPNCTFGAPQGCGSVASWFICFDLVTKSYPLCETAFDCAVSFRTWGDGETGGWLQDGCQLDIPITQNASLNCCAPPTLLFLPQSVCSDNQIDLDLNDFLGPLDDPNNVTYTWTVAQVNGGITGAGACLMNCGNNFSQLLSNPGTNISSVVFDVVASTLDGCISPPYQLTINVLPGIDITIPDPGAGCSGTPVDLMASATGGSGFGYSFDWGDPSYIGSGMNITVIPGISTNYTVTVTDGDGCSNTETILVQANPTLEVDIFPSATGTICSGDFANGFPVVLVATANVGSGWTGIWDTPNGPAFGPQTTASVGGTYCVTLTDPVTNCEGEECIDVDIVAPPFVAVAVLDEEPCQGTDPIDILVPIPTGGIWSSVPAGVVDANGWFIPSNQGINTITYTTDTTLVCSADYVFEIDVQPAPTDPIFSSGPSSLCPNAVGNYCILPVPGATSYLWDLPAGVTINGATDGICIDVTWGSTVGGDVCVTAIGCANSGQICYPVTVPPQPAPATDIIGPDPICSGTMNNAYSTAGNPDASVYTWTIPGSEGSIITGQGSTNITVDWNAGITTADICVALDNNCPSSPTPYCETITFGNVPVQPIAATNITDCANTSGIIASIAAVTGASDYTWTVVSGDATIPSAGNTISETIDLGIANSQICITANNFCGSSPQACFMVNVLNVPANPVAPADQTECSGTTGLNYTIAAVANADDYTWTVVSGNATITSAGNSISETINAGTMTSEICITANNTCGPSGQDCFMINIIDVPADPVAPADQTECANTTGLNYTIASVANADDYTWTVVSGNATITSAGNSISETINVGTMTSEICITANNTCGSSGQDCFMINIIDVPADPVAPADQTECANTNGLNYTIAAVANADDYTWTVVSGNATVTSAGNSISETIDAGTMTSEICITANNTCGSSGQDCFMINIIDVPADPVAPADQTECSGTTGLNYTIATVANADDYTWTVVSGDATITSAGNSISETIDAGTMTSEICITANNTCGSSGQDCFMINIIDVPADPVAPADQTECANTTGLNYTIAAVANADDYTWTVVSGDATITSAGNSISETINVGTMNSEICITANNTCGPSGQDCFMINIIDVPADPVAPADQTECANTAGLNYTITAVANADDYTWTVVSGDATITSAGNSISETIDAGTMTSEICITANNTCGSSGQDCFMINIIDVPADPVAPADQTECANTTGLNYTIAAVANADDYTWTVVSGDATITSAGNSISETIDAGTMTSEICITANNTCGSSGQDCFMINIIDVPADPVAPADQTECANTTGLNYTIASVANADDYTWTVVSGDATITSAGNSISETIDAGTMTSEICITANNTCGSSGQDCFMINIIDVPVAPVAPMDATECANLTDLDFSIAAVANADDYTWTVVSGNANITSGGNSTMATINVGNMTSEICITANNTCGPSVPDCFMINIIDVPAAPLAPADQIECANTVGLNYSIPIVANADDYTWTVVSGDATITSAGNSMLETINAGILNSEICITANNTCGSSLPDCFTITINDIPESPIPPADYTECANVLGIDFTIGQVANADDYTWTVTSGDAIITSAANSLLETVDLGTMNSTICITANNICGSSQPSCFDINVDFPPADPVAPADITECAEVNGLPFDIAAVVGADSYTWTVVSGDASIATGDGSTSVTIDNGTTDSEICITANNDCGSSMPDCFTITVINVPGIPVQDQGDLTICEGEMNANYSVISIAGLTYNWTVPTGATITSGIGTAMITVDWGTAQGGMVSVTAQNSCFEGTATIFDVTADLQLDPPTVACDLAFTDLNQVAFDVSHPTATEFEYTYTVNAGPVQGPFTTTTIPIIVNMLDPLDEVIISVIALGGTNLCGDSPATSWTCSSNDCVDEDPTFTIAQTLFCISDAPYQLTAVEPGGTWSGTGVTSAGLFTPADAGIGIVIIQYSYTDAATNCDQSGTISLEVAGPIEPPMVACGDIQPTSITFDISHADPSITTYEYTYSINAGAPSATQTTTNGMAVVTALTNGDEVTITVEAVGPAPCGNSASTSQSCEIAPCVNEDPTFLNIEPEYCIDDMSVITLQATPVGGTWSGTGVDADGTFHPDQFTMAGTTTLTYSWINTTTNCAQEGDVVLTLVEPMLPASLGCESSTQTSVTFNVGLPAGATGYEYTWTINAGAVQGPLTSNQPTVTIEMLGLNDAVELTVVVLGNNICGNSDAVSVECVSNGCVFITPTVPHDDSYCTSQLPVVFAGTPAGGVFSGNGIAADGTFNPTMGGVYSITYTYTDNLGCDNPVSFQVTVIDAVTAPEVTCGNASTDQVTFNWTSGGATQFSYSWTNITTGATGGPTMTNDLFATVTGLSVNDEVTIIVTAIGQSPCNDAVSLPETCQAQDCPTNVTVDIMGANGPYCIGDTPVQLTGSPAGGDFTGADVSLSGLFTPTTAGMSMVTYTWTEVASGCSYDTDISIEVIAPLDPPDVSCAGSDVSSVTFNVAGGGPYEYTYTINSVPVPGTFNSAGPTIGITGLSINDVVDISVVTIGAAPCGNSPAGTAQCVAFDCPNQSITFGPAPSFCSDGDLTPVQLVTTVIGGDGVTQGTWSGACITPGGLFDPSLCPTGNNTVTFSYEDVAGCPISNTLSVAINAPPAVDAGAMQTWNCAATSLQLDASIGSATGADIIYSWTGTGPGMVTSGGAGLTPDVDGPGTYTLTIQNTTTGCSATDDVVIDNDASAPVITVANGFISCDQGTFTLEALPFDPTYTYLWTGPGITAANETLQNPTVNTWGNYSVEVTASNGCPGSANAMVEDLTADPVAEITSDVNTVTCMTNPFNMSNIDCGNVDPNLVYAWYFSGTLIDNNCQILVDTSGTYSLTVTNMMTGCSADDTFEVTNSVAYPIAGAEVTDELDCIVFDVLLSGEASQTGSTITYEWTGPDILSDPTLQNVQVGSEGPYTLTVYESVSMCSNDTTIFVTDLSNNLPLADAGPNQELDCQETPVQLVGSGSGGLGTLDFEWLDSNMDNLGAGQNLSVDSVGIYTLQVTDSETGCSQTSSVDVIPNTNAPVAFELDAQDPNCVGETNGFINIVDVIGGDGPYLYAFDGEEYSNTSFISNLAPGNYPLSVEDANGCTFDEVVTIAEPDPVSIGLDNPDLNSQLELVMEYGDSTNMVTAQLGVPLSEVQSITWSPAYAVECQDDPCITVLVQPEVTTDLIATVITEDGCEAEARITLVVKKSKDVYFPNVFSPNGDGINDEFGPMFDIEKIEEVESFIIADRWGEIVYTKQNLVPADLQNFEDRFWDGTLAGEPLNPAVFVYYAKIKFRNGAEEEITGDITLMR